MTVQRVHKSTCICSYMNYSPSMPVNKGSMGESTNDKNSDTHVYLRTKSSMKIAWLFFLLWGLELPGRCWTILPLLPFNSLACIILHSTESNSIRLLFFFISSINWLLNSTTSYSIHGSAGFSVLQLSLLNFLAKLKALSVLILQPLVHLLTELDTQNFLNIFPVSLKVNIVHTKNKCLENRRTVWFSLQLCFEESRALWIYDNLCKVAFSTVTECKCSEKWQFKQRTLLEYTSLPFSDA